MKIFFAACLLTLAGNYATAQYYYKDILQTRRTADQMRTYREQQISTVRVASFEADGRPTEGFEGTQTIKDNYSTLVTAVSSLRAGSSELTSIFDREGRLVRTSDTTQGSSSTTEYFYNNMGQLTRIFSRSVSPGPYELTEEHIWFYNNKGVPESMKRVKNNTDTTHIVFIHDGNGNVGEEQSRRSGRSLPTVYYYYDPQNRLTDIVRYNAKAGRLLPDYIFEYDAKGRTSSMLVVPEGSDNYQKWRYTYNEAGLKTEERCFNKQKQLIGRIEYSYR